MDSAYSAFSAISASPFCCSLPRQGRRCPVRAGAGDELIHPVGKPALVMRLDAHRALLMRRRNRERAWVAFAQRAGERSAGIVQVAHDVVAVWFHAVSDPGDQIVK